MKIRLPHIIVFTVITQSAFIAARMTASLYALSNRASAFTVGVVMALFALIPALLAVRAGRWIDQVGLYRPMLLGTSLMTAGALLPAVFPYATTDVAPLLVGAAMMGTGSMFLQMSAQNLVGAEADPGDRPAAFSMLALAFSTSALIAPISTGFLIDAVGHRVSFAVVFAILLCALSAIVLVRRVFPRHEPPPGGHSTAATSAFELLANPELRAVLIVNGLVAMAWDMQTFLIPVHGSSLGMSASQIGLILGAFAAATFTIRLAMPTLSRRYHEWQVLLFTLIAAMVAFALMPFFDSLAPMMAVAFLLGLGLGAAQPNIMSLLHERSPHGRVGEALGLRTTIINSSQVTLPLVLGAFGAVLGAGAGFWLMSALLGVGAWNARQRAAIEGVHADRAAHRRRSGKDAP